VVYGRGFVRRRVAGGGNVGFGRKSQFIEHRPRALRRAVIMAQRSRHARKALSQTRDGLEKL